MKNKIIIIVGLTGILMSINLVAQQDNKPATAPAAPHAPNAPATVTIQRDRTEIIARALNLTDEQKEKVKPIIDDETKKIQELRQKKDITPQERMKKMREIREETYQKMKPILTEEQWKKFYRPLPPLNPPQQGTAPKKPQTTPAQGAEKQPEKK
jgi:Spy/CpxP family protein refolding chaperone